MLLMDLVKEFTKVVKMSKIEGAPELVLDAILTHFGYDDCDLKEGVEKLYTMGKIKHSFRSTLNAGEDMPAILDWFKGVLGISDEDAAKAVNVANLVMLGKKFAAMGHSVSSTKYFELAAAEGDAEAQAKLADIQYVKNMSAMADKFLGMGHKISGKKYLELAASKGCPKAAQRLADFVYAQNMMAMADKFLGMGHKISGKKYVELAAAKGCPCAKAKLATL